MAMRIKIVVVGSHLLVAYKEIKLFGLLPKYTHKILLIFCYKTTLDF